MRISKKERKENAVRFYNMFMNSSCNKAAIVVYRTKSNNNPNINRCQFLAVPSTLAYMENPVVIAESTTHGIEGCFIELLGFIKRCPQKTYFEDGFDDWLWETFNFGITYKDGFVFLLEKEAENNG